MVFDILPLKGDILTLYILDFIGAATCACIHSFGTIVNSVVRPAGHFEVLEYHLNYNEFLYFKFLKLYIFL